MIRLLQHSSMCDTRSKLSLLVRASQGLITKYSDATRPSFSNQVDSAVAVAGVRFPEESEDPDDWLTVDLDNFDALLKQKMKDPASSTTQQAGSEEEELANEQATRMKSLAQKVEEFVEGEGDLEGARFTE